MAIGYADGFLRSLSGSNQHGGGKAFVRGRLVPVVGRISMDLTVLDITELGDNPPLPGEMVEILGDNVSVDDQADPGNTIGYEILTSLKGRYTRSYIDSSEAEAEAATPQQ
ncbi:MAG: alanine racemase C-terminal domain-containing protein [Devosia sp.]